MRLGGFRLLGLVLALSALAWTVLGRQRQRGMPTGPGLREGESVLKVAAMASWSDGPRKYRTAALVFAVALAATFAGAWYAAEQQATTRATAIALTRGEPDHATALLARYGCSGCHTIPGAPGADGKVGPELAGIRERVYVGGVLQNTPANLIGWIIDPQRFSPRSAMPATGITEAEARDVAAYLYSQ